MELVKKMYGKSAQAVVTTHVDKEHIHNHICVCSYTLDGKKLYNTISEVKRARDISDLLCIMYGVRNVMENRARRKGQRMTYCEWMHRKQGTSWKAKISDYILTLLPVADDLEHMLKIMKAHGYTVNRGKYISVLAPGQLRAIRLKSLGDGYDEESLKERIENYIANRPKKQSKREILDEVVHEIMEESFHYHDNQSVLEHIRSLCKQIILMKNEQIYSAESAESHLRKAESKIAKLDAEITDLEAEARHKQLLLDTADRYFGKHKLGEYSAAQKKQDKMLLDKNGITEHNRVIMYEHHIRHANHVISLRREELVELTDKAETYRAIIEECKRDKDDILTRIRKEVDSRLTQQEHDRIESMKAEKFSIYRPAEDYEDKFEEGGPAPNVDDCERIIEGNMFEVRDKGSESEDLSDRLEAVYRYYNLRVGDLIAIGDLAYRVNKQGYSVLKTFTKSRAERERERQEELARQGKERIEAEECQRKQEEQERKKAEEKQNRQSEPKKKKKSI